MSSITNLKVWSAYITALKDGNISPVRIKTEKIKIDLNLWLKSLMCEEIIIFGDYWGDWNILKNLLEKDSKVIGFIHINDFFINQIFDKKKI